MKTSKSKFAIIYCRVASMHQVGNNDLLAKQEKICLKSAKKHENKIKVISDIGGDAFGRGIKDMVDFVTDNKVSSVYISEPTRLSRNFLNFSKIKDFLSRHNVGLKIMSENPPIK